MNKAIRYCESLALGIGAPKCSEDCCDYGGCHKQAYFDYIANKYNTTPDKITIGTNFQMVDSKNIHSPCQSCAIRGHTYSPEDTSCQSCECNIVIQILKKVLKDNDYCKHCKNREYYRGNYGGYYDCKIHDKDFVCVTERDFVINWDSVFEEYGGF